MFLKKCLCSFVIAASLLSLVFSEPLSYRIDSIEYDITGLTRKYSLSNKVPVDTETVFENEELFLEYIEHLNQNLKNQRVLQSSEISIAYSEPDSNGLVKVTLGIKTKDSFNFIVAPYPTYDVNSGFKLKLKIKDYNFLGSMEQLNSSLVYFYRVDEDSGESDHYLDFSFGFDYPFGLGPFNCNWSNDFSINYVMGDNHLGYSITEGVSFGLPIFNITSLNLGLSQSIIKNPEYNDYGDMRYFNTSASLSMPFKLAEIKDVGTLTWTPYASFNFNWDFDVFMNAANYGITCDDLKGPTFNLSQVISIDSVDWIENFRSGFLVNIRVSYSYNLSKTTFTPSINMTSQFFKNFGNFGIATKQYLFFNLNESTSIVGDSIRGVRNNDIYSTNALALNFDLPIKLLQTDWSGWFKKLTGVEASILSTFDFEAQFSPFLDFVIGHNTVTGSFFSPADSYFGCGFEILGFPDKFRSIQGRLSLGFDMLQVAKMIGDKVDFVDKVTDKLFNTSWRNNSWWELFFGIGLFY